MRVNKPTLHPMARSALVEIQASGVEITPDMVLWVQDAATRIAINQSRPSADLVDWPVEAGGVLLYPLSFGAIEWLSGLPDRMRYDVRVIAFAAVYSHKPEVFLSIRSPLKAGFAVTKWILKLPCSYEALSVAVDQVLGCGGLAEVDDVQKRENKDDSWEWGAVIRKLCLKYSGTTPDYWMWGGSREKAFSMLKQDGKEKDEPGFVSDYEKEMTVQYRSIIEHIKAEKYV